jgi:hypothetical protein
MHHRSLRLKYIVLKCYYLVASVFIFGAEYSQNMQMMVVMRRRREKISREG